MAHICQLSIFHILLENTPYSVILLAYNMSLQRMHHEQNGFQVQCKCWSLISQVLYIILSIIISHIDILELVVHIINQFCSLCNVYVCRYVCMLYHEYFCKRGETLDSKTNYKLWKDQMKKYRKNLLLLLMQKSLT